MRFPARAFFLISLLASPVLLSGGAAAQMWPNETSPGGDMMAGSARQFDRIRPVIPAPMTQELPVAPTVAGVPTAAWTPPPLPQEAAPARPGRRAAGRGATPRRAAVARRSGEGSRNTRLRSDEAAQRRFTAREAEIERLRSRLESDRNRYDSQRANTAIRSAPQPASPALTR
ncbi:hypothetical protein BKE38_09480 [Pseudoroseomonas deserti]|uniref:BZIP domain-containing protein n=1 Tax=Teichococcus deserti TaxID=1817963 RepID=A0A1V2H450_9PROT|nr:hypothetical protein [Pseudoroseomonas deserti]ONG54957.1 hypothetical protein BKE38_09480 [Pseudoroseomonas deserti]